MTLSNRRNSITPFFFCFFFFNHGVDRKQFENRVYWKRLPGNHHVFSLPEFLSNRIAKMTSFSWFLGRIVNRKHLMHFQSETYVLKFLGVLWNGCKWNCSLTSDAFISLLLAAFIDPPGRGANASPSWEQANSKMETTHNKTKEEEIFFITINKTEQ